MTDKTQHTPEPWISKNILGFTDVYSADNNLLCAVYPCEEHLLDVRNANAARIAACVNAMQGIDDPETWMKTTKEILDSNLKLQANWSKVIDEQRGHIDMLHQELEKLKGANNARS
jgi:hypothetical protein